MHFASLLLALLPLSLAGAQPVIGDKAQLRSRARAVSENNNQLAKRQTYGGRATFYDVGLGACGWTNVESDYIVALNSPQYGGGYPGPNCGRSITISANGVQVQATIADQCPSCGYGDLDLSRSLFNRFASPDAGVFHMSWWYNDGNSQPQAQPTTTQAPAPTSTYTPPAPTSTYTPPPPTSTYTPPAPTTSASPSTTQASSAAANVQSSSSSSSSSSSLIPSNSATNGTSPFVVTSNSTASSTTSADPSTGTTVPTLQNGNLAAFNRAVLYLGNIVVVGAQKD